MMAPSISSRSSNGPKEEWRMTKGGRKITYSMEVMQQPERARACGSGAKSSADRRPVDPPPVVELRIFSGEGPEREDITFAYEANFFLFATLEARPIARSRLPQAAAAPIPVLTGMPVAGMAYLDRPREAGFFIFPDLSVRHEGQYQLSFSLYEETKNDCDKDAETSERKPAGFGAPGAPDASFDWRMELKSREFTVFSAKKFPGLKESTTLSRVISEQGCRVRIRRDVRMRRREPNKEVEEEIEYTRQGRTPSGDDPWGEPRSRSNSHSPTRLGFENRPGETIYSGQPPRPSLEFGPEPHFAVPPPNYPPPMAAPAQPYPPPQTYQSQAPAPYRQPPEGYAQERQYPQSAYPSNPPREALPFEKDIRRTSTSYIAPASTTYPPIPPMEYAHQHTYRAPEVQLPPLKLKAAPPTPRVPSLQELASFHVGSSRIEPERPSYYVEPRNGKRDHSSSFPSLAEKLDHQRPMNGMRPDLAAVDEDDDNDTYQPVSLQYPRADGTWDSKQPVDLHE